MIGYVDSVARWIIQWCFIQAIIDLSFEVNITFDIQVQSADESQMGQNIRPELYC